MIYQSHLLILCLLLSHPFFSLPPPLPDYLQHLLSLRRRSQILVPIFSDKEVVFDPDAPNGPVMVENRDIDVFAEDGVAQVIGAERVYRKIAISCQLLVFRKDERAGD